jgi:hypothetical protein
MSAQPFLMFFFFVFSLQNHRRPAVVGRGAAERRLRAAGGSGLDFVILHFGRNVFRLDFILHALNYVKMSFQHYGQKYIFSF